MPFSRGVLIRGAGLIGIGALIVVVLVSWVAGKGLLERIGNIAFHYFLLAILIETAFMLLWTLRWSIIIHAQGKRVPRGIAAITFSAAFFNNITPVSKTGGEPVRAYLLGKANNTSFEEGMASVIADRIFDMVPFVLICLTTFALIIAFKLPSNPLVLTLILFGLSAAAAISAIIALAYFRRKTGLRAILFLVGKLEPVIVRFRPVDDLKERTRKALDRFYLGIESISSDTRSLLASLMISLLLWLMVILRLKVVFLSLGADISLLVINVVAVASVFSSFAPLLPGGLGTTEATMIVLFIAFGIERDLSSVAVLVDRMASFWFVTIVGAFCSAHVSLKLIQQKKG